VVRLFGSVVIPVVVVAARGQALAEPLGNYNRRDTLPQVESLLGEDKLRAAFRFDAVRTRRVQPAEMA
jgi:hypothetical protein